MARLDRYETRLQETEYTQSSIPGIRTGPTIIGPYQKMASNPDYIGANITLAFKPSGNEPALIINGTIENTVMNASFGEMVTLKDWTMKLEESAVMYTKKEKSKPYASSIQFPWSDVRDILEYTPKTIR